MKIITSNIRFNNPNDGNNSWDERKSFYCEKLNELSPLILGTQEGREPQLRSLESGLINKTLIDMNRVWISERMYPCLFLDKTSSVIDSGDRWLSPTPIKAGSKLEKAAFPRMFTWAKFIEKGVEILVVNTHLDHTTDDVRLAQCKILVDEILKINNENLPLIIMGDFNCAPYEEVYQYLLKSLKLVDPWVKQGKAEETSYHKFIGKFDAGKRIDWILHSNHFESLTIELVKDHQEGKYLSDHFPVVCDIILKEK